MKKYSFILLLLLSIFFIPKSVYAFYEVDYDYSISVFNKYGYDISLISDLANMKLLIDPDGYLRTAYVSGSIPSGYTNLTTTVNGRNYVSLETIKRYFPYHMHLSYNTFVSNKNYDIYIACMDRPFVDNNYQLKTKKNPALPDNLLTNNDIKYPNCIMITNIPSDYYDYELFYYNGGNESLTTSYHNPQDDLQVNSWNMSAFGLYGDGFGFTYDVNSSLGVHVINNIPNPSNSFRVLSFFIFNNVVSETLSAYYNYNLRTNFDLKYIDINGNNVSTQLISEEHTGFDFGTDVEVKVPYSKQLVLVPSTRNNFNSYIWANSNFHYLTINYNNDIFTPLDSYSYDDMYISIKNSYANWSKWNIAFTSEELLEGRAIGIENHNDSEDLYIKFKSTDFFYELRDINSNGSNIGGVYVPDFYDYQNGLAMQHTINNTYGIPSNDDVSDMFKMIPQYLKGFVKSFAFLGTLLVSFFTLITTEIGSYYIIIFTLILFVIVIKILR